MDIVTPIGFWRRYKEEITKLEPNLSKYSGRTVWTALTRDAAMNAICSADLESVEPLTASKEYLRVDVIGEKKIEPAWNWLLRIAFEHENEFNRNQWMQELCKLAHVVADLRVLVAYYDSGEGDVQSKLQERVSLLEAQARRITRVPDSRWLFIFGPAGDTKDNGGKFLAYTLENGTTVVRLPDDNPLVPRNWR